MVVKILPHWKQGPTYLNNMTVNISVTQEANTEGLTHEQPETHGYILNTVANDALVLKHQAVSINSAD